MKFLILLLLAFSASANFVKEIDLDEKLLDCNYPMFTHREKKKCGADCIKLDKNFQCESFEKINKMKNDTPIWGERSFVEPCLDDVNCQEILSTKNCVEGRHAIYSLELLEVWCNKITGYTQIPSGEKMVSENLAKKAAFLAQKQSKKDAEKSKKDSLKLIKIKLKDGIALTPSETNAILKYVLRSIK